MVGARLLTLIVDGVKKFTSFVLLFFDEVSPFSCKVGLYEIPCKSLLAQTLSNPINAEDLNMCQVYADGKSIKCQWRLDVAIVMANMCPNSRIALLG